MGKSTRCMYESDLNTFLQIDSKTILGELCDSYHGAALTTTIEAWKGEIDILQSSLCLWNDGHIIFEYDIPRLGKRVDVVLLLKGIVFCLEFKVGESKILEGDIDQVLDYALDLKNFHKLSADRLIVPGLLAILIGSVTSKRFLYPSKQAIPKVVVLSLFQTIIQYLFFYIGLAHTDGTKASIIEGMNVFVAIVVSSLIFRLEKLTIRKVLGCLVGFVGVLLVNISGTSLDMNMTLTGEGFIFLSTVSYAFSSVMLKLYSKEENTVMLSGWQFLFGGIVMAVAGWLMGGRIGTFTSGGLMMLIYLAFVSAVAYSLWSLLLTYNPVSRVAVFGFMNPLIGFILSAILLREYSSLSIVALLSLVLVCTGIYIVNKVKTVE